MKRHNKNFLDQRLVLFDFQIVTDRNVYISLQTSTLSFFSINASVKLYPKSVVMNMNLKSREINLFGSNIGWMLRTRTMEGE